MSKGVEIHYGDVAPEAKENFVASASEKETFVRLTDFQKYNLLFDNYGNPCERYQTPLDGSAVLFPANPQNSNMGLWSVQISNDKGVFTTPIVLTLKSEGQYSSQGLTLTFDAENNIHATDMTVRWYRNGSLLSEKAYEPDSALYFCQNKVENYDEVVLTFYAINMPKNRLKLRVIDYGYGTVFRGDELRNVKLIQEIDPLSTEISINTADFSLDSKRNIEYSFQAKQPLSVYFNGELKATTFVKKSSRKAKFLWQIQSEDYIGLLDSIPYYGGIYSNAKAVDILADIFTVAKVPYSVADEYVNAKVSGYIAYTTCREALMQVAFAIQAVVDTSDSDVIRIYSLDKQVKQTVPLSRIMQGQSFSDEETVTGVEVVAHAYSPIEETLDAYSAEESGTGKNIFVKFSEPLHSLSITNGTIVSRETNYAIIDANEGCVLVGKKYEHTTQAKRKNNPVVLASEIEKIVAVEDAMLVSSANIDNILDGCYNWLTKTNSTSLKIVEGKHIKYGEPIKYGQQKYGTFVYGGKTENQVTYDAPVRVGENLQAETEYLGIVGGVLIKQTFNLNGNIIVKEAVLR